MSDLWNLTEPQRRQLREAQAAAKAAKSPSRPWRVYGPGEHFEDRRSETAAYARAGAVTANGEQATVYHWEGGSWRLYEVVGKWDSVKPDGGDHS